MRDLKRNLYFLLALLAAAGFAGAADLSYNTGATTNLTGDVSYENVLVGVNGGTSATIVDATGTTSFSANGSQFYIGVWPGSGETSLGKLYLAGNNNIIATQLTIGGGQPDGNGNAGNVGTLTTAASGTTTVSTANMAIGTGKGTGTFTLGAGATLTLYGQTGSGSRAGLVVGRWSAFNSHSGNGTLNLSGGGTGLANLNLNELAVAKVTSSSGGSGTACSGNITFSSTTNHLDVSGAGNVVKVGYNNQSGGNGITATGTLTINNLDATSSITSTDNSTAVFVGFRGGSGQAANGTLNLNGGTLTITTTGAAIAGAEGTAGAGTSSLNLKDCTLKAGASSTNWISGLTTATMTGNVIFDSGTNSIVVPQNFTGTGSLVKEGSGTLTLSGTNTYAGTTTVSNGNMLVNGSIASNVTVKDGAAFGGSGGTVTGNVTLQSGANGLFTTNTLDITGSLVLSGDNAVHLILPEELGVGTYTLATFNTVGSSGSFSRMGVIDSGSAKGAPIINVANGTVEMEIIMWGTLILVR